MTKEELEKEAEEKTAQYMNEHTKKYNCENTKLETDNYNTGREYGYEDGYIAGAWPREKRIAELEKENAELKESGSVICDRLSERIDEIVELKNENIGLKNQLTKAKEIIKNLLILKNDHYGNTKMKWRVKVTEQAEQFLNSEVEK